MEWYWWVGLVLLIWFFYRNSITNRMNKDPKQLELYELLKSGSTTTDNPFDDNYPLELLRAELEKIKDLDGDKKLRETIGHLHSLLSIDTSIGQNNQNNAGKILKRLTRNGL
jgi:hypothetical protein